MFVTPTNRHEVFISYSHKDKVFRDELVEHLSALQREGRILVWHDRCIVPGTEWEPEIVQHVEMARVILCLISASFISSDYCYRIEMARAIQRHEAGEARVIPIIIRPCDWKRTPLGALQALPQNAKAVATWDNQDEAWLDVVYGIRDALNDLSRTDLVSTTGASPVASPQICGLPHRNPYFTGRDDVLDRMRAALIQNKAPNLPRMQAVSGLGGIGKTQIAIEYAYRNMSDYQTIIWINASSQASLLASYLSAAQTIGLSAQLGLTPENLQDGVVAWLNSHDNWLIIYDGADNPVDVRPFLPTRPGGHVLLTSRSHHLDILGIPRPLQLDAMTKAEASQFLSKRTARDNIAPQESEAATNLAAELGYLPLALEQAAAYMVAKHASFIDYFKSYQALRLQMLNRQEPVAGDYSYCVATTWEMNIREVEAESEAAFDLLRFGATLLHRPKPASSRLNETTRLVSLRHFTALNESIRIPFELIMRGRQALGPAVSRVLFGDNHHPLAVNEALEPLLRYSLISLETGDRAYGMHPLVSEVERASMGEEERRRWEERAVSTVAQAFPDKVHGEERSWCEILYPHAQTALRLIQEGNIQTESAAALLAKTAYYLLAVDEPREAEVLLRYAISIRKTVFGTNSPEVVDDLGDLAMVLESQGRHDEAHEQFERLIAIERERSQPDSRKIATALTNLGDLAIKRRCFERAEQLLRQALKTYRRVSGEDHYHHIIPTLLLAGLYAEQHKFAEAERRYLRSLKLAETSLPSNGAELGYVLNNYGQFLRWRGQLDKAERLLRRSVEVLEARSGPSHPDVIQPAINLATLLAEQARFAEAYEYGVVAAIAALSTYPVEHLVVKGCMNHLNVLVQNGGGSNEIRFFLRGTEVTIEIGTVPNG